MRERLGELGSFVASVRRDGLTDVVLLGMGGSSLAAEVLAATFGPAPGQPRLTILDTTDPGTIHAVRGRVTLARTLFLVASKSGTTAEMLALYRFFRAELAGRVARPGTHFVAITDPKTPLGRLAVDDGFRHTFLNDPEIGGRFSALSCFGLVPGALLGVDLPTLLDDAVSMATRCRGFAPLRAFGAWLEQLLTESTGKQGKGLVVIHEEPPGPPAAYGDDRVFVAIALGEDRGVEAAVAPLEAAGHPVVRLTLGSRSDLGGEFFRWEMATALAGVVLGVNPFDEPNVAQAKAATGAALDAFLDAGRLPEVAADDADDVARALAAAKPGDYVALLAYLTPAPATAAALQQLRALVRDRTRLATTAGWGPRYLHSTGQLHKGGPNTPLLLVLTARDRHELAIPGEGYGFSTLKLAQALGDVTTLRAAGRRAFWVPLGDAPEAGLAALAARLARHAG